MSWTLLSALVVALGAAFLVASARRVELARMQRALGERERARRAGSDRAELAHPFVDLSRCLGCGTCVAACPEDGVLALVHGQAQVVNGARCRGHAACERECPVGAITVGLADLAQRRDVPALSAELEAVGVPNLFLAGELTAHTLIKSAIEQGTAVAAEVARRARATGANGSELLDLCIVGAGPAGLACSLEAKRRGLSFVTLEREQGPGGTVARYPRRKLVTTQPVELPLYGRLARTSYAKEELVEIWNRIAAEEALPIRGGESLESVARASDGSFSVRTSRGTYAARHVCLALGRRGAPTKLGVPGEELPKVAYGLMDARSVQGRRALVVGGGDSAVETALALAEEPGNDVVLSYRQASFFRVRERSAERLHAAAAAGRVQLLMQSEVRAIAPGSVELDVQGSGGARRIALANDEVFVMAGGGPPFEMLQRAGVSFDPALRPATKPVQERGNGLAPALAIGLAFAVGALAFALAHADYYLLPAPSRPAHEKHFLLRPGLGLGLAFGLAAAGLVGLNLLYLLRRRARGRLALGSLSAWMTSHVATGILAFLCATLHAAMTPRATVGGHAYLALAVLVATGAVGRYFYAWVPRAANGRELELLDVQQRLARIAGQWTASAGRFAERAEREVAALVASRQWRASFFGRVLALLGGERELARVLRRLAWTGRAQGVAPAQIAEALALARRAHRAALAASHLEDLRALLSTWRWLHRWMAALLVLLIVLHVANALFYGAHYFGGGAR